jgi:hypothetical protein
MLRLTRQQIFASCRRKLKPAELAAQGQLAVPSVADRAVGSGQGMRLGAAPAAAASPAADSGRHASSPSSPTSARGSRGVGRAEALSRSQALNRILGLVSLGT